MKELREKGRDEALQSYGSAMRTRMHQQQISESIQQRIEGMALAIQDRGRKRFPASMQSVYYTALHDAKQQLKESDAVLQEHRAAERERQHEYLERKSRHDVLQRLHDRRREEHFTHEFKEEEKVLEDLANARASIPSHLTTAPNL